MVTKATRSEPSVRSDFFPDSIDCDALPEAVVELTYREMVLGVATLLERSAGVSLTFLLSLEILDPFEIGHQLNFAANPAAVGGPERDRLIARYLRIVVAKRHAEKTMFRVHELRAH